MTRCYAYNEDGSVCLQPANHLDAARGFYVCAKHAPQIPNPPKPKGTSQ